MTEISLQNTTRRKIQQCQIASICAIISKIKATKRKQKDLFDLEITENFMSLHFKKINNAIVFSFLAIQNIKNTCIQMCTYVCMSRIGIFYVDVLFNIHFV